MRPNFFYALSKLFYTLCLSHLDLINVIFLENMTVTNNKQKINFSYFYENTDLVMYQIL